MESAQKFTFLNLPALTKGDLREGEEDLSDNSKGLSVRSKASLPRAKDRSSDTLLALLPSILPIWNGVGVFSVSSGLGTCNK